MCLLTIFPLTKFTKGWGWGLRIGSRGNYLVMQFTRCSFQILDHSVKVEAPGVLVPVAVLADLLEPAVLEDHAVVAPENESNQLK